MSLTITRPSIPVPLPLTRGGTDATTPAGARASLELGDLALLTAPGGTTTFLRADKTWAVPPGGGGVSTFLELTDTPDAFTGQGGLSVRVNAGATALEFAALPAASETVAGVVELATTAEVTTGMDTTRAVTPAGLAATLPLTTKGDLLVRDASATSRLPVGTDGQVLTADAALALGVKWATPADAGTNYWSRSGGVNSTIGTGLLGYWHLEEATGSRLDSVGTNHLVPTGTTVQVSSLPGKIGQALAMDGTNGTYLSCADNATLSAGPNMSFSLACWVYVTNTGLNHGFVGKGTATPTSAYFEYQLWQYSGAWRFDIGNGSSSFVTVASSFTPVANQWCLLIAWYDHVADLQYIQVNNGTPNQVANAVGSYDSALPFEVGRTAGFASQSLNGRVDMVMFAKRVWTAQERADLWNNGNGLAYPFALGARLSPSTPGDQVLLAATATTDERLEVDGAIKLGTTGGTTNGTLRWSGTDFEGRKGGAWVSMTSGGGGQPLDATLTALAPLATGADTLPYFTGTDTASQTPLTALARTLLDDTTQAAMRTTLGLTPGTDVQAQDAELQALAGLTSAADRLPYFTGAGAAALATFTTAGRTLVAGADAAAQRGALGLGTMAVQNADVVAITGGSATGLSALSVVGDPAVNGNTSLFGTLGIGVTAPTGGNNLLHVGGTMGVQHAPASNVDIYVVQNKLTQFGMYFETIGSDVGNPVLSFQNLSSSTVGSITTTASATAFNTSSDARLKSNIATLAGALERVRALRPVSFTWQADDSPGQGFLAHELQRTIPEAVSGEPDAVNDDGSIRPQQVDHSRLVPWLTAALQATMAQLDAAVARITTLEEAQGL